MRQILRRFFRWAGERPYRTGLFGGFGGFIGSATYFLVTHKPVRWLDVVVYAFVYFFITWIIALAKGRRDGLKR